MYQWSPIWHGNEIEVIVKLSNQFYIRFFPSFIVCDFKARSGVTQRGIPIQTISRSSQFNNTVYPLEIGIKVTDFYEQYFGIDYALPKQGILRCIRSSIIILLVTYFQFFFHSIPDLIAIPDFVSGAVFTVEQSS